MTIKITRVILILFLSSFSLHAQTLSYYQGNNFPISDEVVSAIGSTGEIFSNRFSFVQFEYPILSSLSITASYSTHSTWTEFHIDHPDKSLIGRSRFGHGSSRIRQRRYGVGCQYDIIDLYNVLELKLVARVEYEKSINGRSLSTSSIVRTLNPDDVIDYFPAVASVQTHPGSQVIPTIGFGARLNLLWRVSVNIDYAWTFGHRRSQTIFLDYSFQGEPQPRAEWFSDGSMHIIMLGVSLKVFGEKSKVNDRIRILK